MDTVRRYAMLIDGDWVDTDDRFEIRSPATEELVASVARNDTTIAREEKFVHLDLSGRLDRRAYPLLLGTPPA
jgi:hypothetical protein